MRRGLNKLSQCRESEEGGGITLRSETKRIGANRLFAVERFHDIRKRGLDFVIKLENMSNRVREDVVHGLFDSRMQLLMVDTAYETV